MTFFLNLLYSIWCTERLDYVYSRSNAPKKFLSYFILLTPLWLVWLLICGGQYDVGTDYFSYYNIFKSADISWYADTKAEWMFTWIVETFRGWVCSARSVLCVLFHQFLFLMRHPAFTEASHRFPLCLAIHLSVHRVQQPAQRTATILRCIHH